MVENILVPIDGSAHSKKALEFACELAGKYDALIYLLHVVESPPRARTIFLGASAAAVESENEDLEQAGEHLMGFAKEFIQDRHCSAVETVVVGGTPAQHIIEFAKKHSIDMIVMGSRGLSDFAGLLLGSVSHKVTHLAECTCVTVR